MNRHRAYWSQMHDEQKEESQIKKDFDEFRRAAKIFSGKYGMTDMLTIVRKLYEEEQNNQEDVKGE